MILPARELEHFSHAEFNFKTKTKSYNEIGYDEVIIHYSKKKWYGLKRWKRIYKFNRRNIEQNGKHYWEESTGCLDLRKQLNAISNAEWTYVPTDVYKEFLEKYPEYKL